jgi:hypothetical protein
MWCKVHCIYVCVYTYDTYFFNAFSSLFFSLSLFLFFHVMPLRVCVYMYVYICIYIYIYMICKQSPGIHVYIHTYIKNRVYILRYSSTCLQVQLENITTEPHTQDISADILRVWLSGYILQQVHCGELRFTHIHKYVQIQIMCMYIDIYALIYRYIVASRSTKEVTFTRSLLLRWVPSSVFVIIVTIQSVSLYMSLLSQDKLHPYICHYCSKASCIHMYVTVVTACVKYVTSSMIFSENMSLCECKKF